jgi:predicted TIM-barrel fold metal-dependent hydrolase
MCFISDQHAIRSLDEMPTKQLMWESDYPHSDSLWPNSRQHLAEALEGVDDEIARDIAELNARRLFDFW